MLRTKKKVQVPNNDSDGTGSDSDETHTLLTIAIVAFDIIVSQLLFSVEDIAAKERKKTLCNTIG